MLAGGAGVEWLFGYNFAHNDINLEDFRSRDQMWRQTKIAIDFFQQHLPFAQMQSADEYALPAGTFCFALPGKVYALQSRGGDQPLHLWLPKATYSVAWFHSRQGGKLVTGSVASVNGAGFTNLGSPPREISSDWIALVALVGEEPKDNPPPPSQP